MALFDRYVQAQQPGARVRKGASLAVSSLIHAAVMAALVAMALHVVAKPQPPVTLTLFRAAAPPPPPPPPAGGPVAQTAAIQVKPKVKTRPMIVRTPTVKQPTPTEAPEPETNPPTGVPGGKEGGITGGVVGGVVGGVTGGVPGGVVGGVVGGTGTGPPHLVAPNVALGQKLISPDPEYTHAAQAAGLEGTVTAKICVDTAGHVSNVSVLRHMAMGMDDSVSGTVKSWRFRPFLYNGSPIPFCYVANFVFRLR